MSKKKKTPSLQTTVGPNIDDLKSKFVAHSIPLEGDFADLINVADCGRRAAGLSPDVAPAMDTGLILDENTGQLKVRSEADRGISVTDSGVGVVANTAKGVIVDGSGVGVVANTAKGVIVDGSGVGVVANTAKGVIVDGSGVGVNHDSTLRIVNTNQLGVADNYVTKNGDSTITGGGLTFGSDDKGISFFGGGRIIKKLGGNMLWYKGTNNALPQICNNDGSNASNIATEQYVTDSISGSSDDLYIRVLCSIHAAQFYGFDDNFMAVGSTNSENATIVTVYSRGAIVHDAMRINGQYADTYNKVFNHNNEPFVHTAIWLDFAVSNGMILEAHVRSEYYTDFITSFALNFI